MLIKKLLLNNFRNYSKFEVEFNKGINIIIGNNGVGKTNILEAISIVSDTKSFRKVNDNSLIKQDEVFARISLNTEENTFKVSITSDGKNFFINNQHYQKLNLYLGKFVTISFIPNDTNLVSESPKYKRRFIDLEISKTNKAYLKSLSVYLKLVEDKNKLLKSKNPNIKLIEIINNSMVNHIKDIVITRGNYFDYINTYINSYYTSISGVDCNVKVVYKKCFEINDINIQLNKALNNDLKYSYCSVGPHHDDYYFEFKGLKLNDIASQGQKRMVVISFKLAIIKYIEEILKEKVVVLLDDLLSELDEKNIKRLLNNLPDNQFIITHTNQDIIKMFENKEYKVIKL